MKSIMNFATVITFLIFLLSSAMIRAEHDGMCTPDLSSLRIWSIRRCIFQPLFRFQFSYLQRMKEIMVVRHLASLSFAKTMNSTMNIVHPFLRLLFLSYPIFRNDWRWWWYVTFTVSLFTDTIHSTLLTLSSFLTYVFVLSPIFRNEWRWWWWYVLSPVLIIAVIYVVVCFL